MGGTRSTNGEMRNAYIILVEKQKGKRTLGRQRRRWEDNMGIDLGEVGWSGMDWIGPAQNRKVKNSCEFGIEPSGYIIKC
jgi:hypothetical protein